MAIEVIDLRGQSLLWATEGDVTAADTETALATWGSQGATTGKKLTGTIQTIVVQNVTDGAAAGEMALWVRIRGQGGQQIDLPCGAITGGAIAHSGPTPQLPVVYKVNIPWNGPILAYGEAGGTDAGTMYCAVALYGQEG